MIMKIIDINSFTIFAISLLGSMTYKIKTRLVKTSFKIALNTGFETAGLG